MSASSVGSTRSTASISSTSLPRRANADATSAPDAPQPTTARRAGSSGSAYTSSVPITRLPNCVPGIASGTEPVARITMPAASVAPLTLTWPSAVSEPRPSISSMRFFRNRPATPEVSVVTTFSRRACTPA